MKLELVMRPGRFGTWVTKTKSGIRFKLNTPGDLTPDIPAEDAYDLMAQFPNCLREMGAVHLPEEETKSASKSSNKMAKAEEDK